MVEDDFIRVYHNGGHIPGIPGFFPIGFPVRVDERTNQVLPDESPPALPAEHAEIEQPLLPEQASSESAEQKPVENVTVDTSSNPFGMLGGNN